MGYGAIMDSKIGRSTVLSTVSHDTVDDICEWPLDDTSSETSESPDSVESPDEEIGLVCTHAILHGTSEVVVNYLMEQMEDPKSYRDDDTGETLLHFAVANTNWLILAEVLDQDFDPNAVDFTGRTSSHVLYRTNAVSAIDLLARHGADFLIEDYEGNTAFSNLLKYKNFRMANHLLKHLSQPLTYIGFTDSEEIEDLIKVTGRQRRRSNTPEHKLLAELLIQRYHFILQILPLVARIRSLENRAEQLCQA